MKKEILFDMDGTIADLYGYPGWLEKIKCFDSTPYLNAKPRYNNHSLLTALVRDLKRCGYKIKIVSAFPYADTTTEEFNAEIAKAKRKWLEDNHFPYDEVYFIPYEENKGNYSSPECDISILVDDNQKVRKDFMHASKAKNAETIDATENILIALANLIKEEI
ncbi:MAG: hypothetical protein [Caudoviricetes sp.]|nr:MAG: hypothetical protein [Caudoviricetes sp.]